MKEMFPWMAKTIGVPTSETAQSVLEPNFFLEQVKEAGESGAPFDLWAAVRFFPGPDFEKDQSLIARTMGLEPFIGREIECGPYAKAPEELGPLTRAIGYYVLDRRVEFEGGETIGADDNPIGAIELARTQVGFNNTAVYRLVLEGMDNG
jgi:hypothetical protein